jgi:hypothetical protein
MNRTSSKRINPCAVVTQRNPAVVRAILVGGGMAPSCRSGICLEARRKGDKIMIDSCANEGKCRRERRNQYEITAAGCKRECSARGGQAER